jgi:hypothetical protein
MSENAMKALSAARRLEDRDVPDGQERRGKKPKTHPFESKGPFAHTSIYGDSGICKFLFLAKTT